MAHSNDDGIVVDDHDAWLEATDPENSEETRGWYVCPEGEESDYINNHQDWWDNL